MKPLHALALLAALPFLVGCPAGPTRPKVAFVTNMPAEFWDLADAGTRKAQAEEPDVEILFRSPPQADTGVQKETLETIVNQQPKAVCISVIDPGIQTPYLDEIAKKTTVMTVDTDAPDSKRVCFIGADNYEAGKAVGALLKESQPEGGTVALFIGNMTQTNSRQRVQGFLDELAGAKDQPVKDGATYGKYKLYKLYTEANAGQEAAKANAVTCLDEIGNEEKLSLVGLFAYNPPAILLAVQDKKKDRLGKIKIVGFDEDAKTLDGIRDGHIHGTVSQQPFLYGYHAGKLMAAVARGKQDAVPKNGRFVVDHIVVTKDGHAVKSALGGEKVHKGEDVEKFRKELEAAVKSVKSGKK